MLTDKYGREVLAPANFLLEVQQGKVPGVSVVSVRGFNPDVDTASYEDMIPWGGLYPWPAAAVTPSIVSTSAADAAAGTGARTVFVDGLNTSFLPQNETVTMAGLTPVLLTKLYRRINSMIVSTAGTDLRNIGTVTLAQGANTLAQILPNEGIDKSGVYTIPAGYAGYLNAVIASAAKGGQTDSLQVALATRDLTVADKPFLTGFDLSLASAGSSTIEVDAFLARYLGPRDFTLRCYGATANNLAVYGRLSLFLEAL